MGKVWKGSKIMRIKIIKFVVKALGYEWGGDQLNLPYWTVKEKKKDN